MRSFKWLLIFFSLLLILGAATATVIAMSGHQFLVRYNTILLSVIASITGIGLLIIVLSLLLYRRAFDDSIKQDRHFLQLRESEQKYRELVENANSVILRMDRSGKIIYFNKFAQQLFGYSDEEIEGRSAVGTVFSVRESGGRDNTLLVAAVCSSPETYPLVETECMTRDGRKLFISWANRGCRDAEGQLTEVLSIGQDVTEQKRLQEIMIFSEKMMTMGGLAAGMAHELNNPLGGILQNAQNLVRRLSSELPANLAAAKDSGLDLAAMEEYLRRRGVGEILAYIIASSERSADIVARMLAFSQRGQGEKQLTGLAELIDHTIELASCDYDLKKRYNFRSIPVIRQYEEGLPQIFVNAVEVEQVFLNLLKNAAQAISEVPGDPSTHRIVVRTRLQAQHVAIDIEDDGPGIPPENRARIFEPFFTTKEVGTGTGLGLAVSYSIIANNNGAISLDTSYEEGARFTILFPLESNPI